MHDTNLKVVFFGGEPLGVPALEALFKANIIPDLVVCNTDKPVGRDHIVTLPPVKIWAQEHDIEVLQPDSLKDQTVIDTLTKTPWDLFIVVAYSKILPKVLVDFPKFGTINLHPSLLPKLRGASPIRTSILEGLKDTGVTIMLMDELMDHGPILAQKRIEVEEPILGRDLDTRLSKEGAELLAKTIPSFINGEISPNAQDHTQATYCSKITKDMGELQIDPFNLPMGAPALEAMRKICAFDGAPGTFFIHEGKRIKITDALLEKSEPKLIILRVIPEGKKEMDFGVYLKSL